MNINIFTFLYDPLPILVIYVLLISKVAAIISLVNICYLLGNVNTVCAFILMYGVIILVLEITKNVQDKNWCD